MNVILNTDEVYAVLSRVSSQVIDRASLSEKGKERLREWRREHDVDTLELNELTLQLNRQLGNSIDERTTRMVRLRGKQKARASARWQS